MFTSFLFFFTFFSSTIAKMRWSIMQVIFHALTTNMWVKNLRKKLLKRVNLSEKRRGWELEERNTIETQGCEKYFFLKIDFASEASQLSSEKNSGMIGKKQTSVYGRELKLCYHNRIPLPSGLMRSFLKKQNDEKACEKLLLKGKNVSIGKESFCYFSTLSRKTMRKLIIKTSRWKNLHERKNESLDRF